MRNIELILIYLFSPVITFNIDRDKFNITSCQNFETLEPEMTILFPTSIVPENERYKYQFYGEYVELIIQENQLNMIEMQQRKFVCE